VSHLSITCQREETVGAQAWRINGSSQLKARASHEKAYASWRGSSAYQREDASKALCFRASEEQRHLLTLPYQRLCCLCYQPRTGSSIRQRITPFSGSGEENNVAAAGVMAVAEQRWAVIIMKAINGV